MNLPKDPNTHIFTDDGAQALDPQNTSPAELANKQTLAGEHGLAEALRLVILGHARRAREESVFAGAPRLFTRHANVGDVAERERSQQQLARACVRRHRHLAAGDELLHAELDGALESHRGRHGNHAAGLGLERTADRKLDGDDGVAVAVADTIAATVESANIVDCRAGAGEVALWWGTARHGRESAGVVWSLGLFLLFLRI